MSQLQINLFGGFTVTVNEQPVTQFRSAKSRALLAYLAAQPDREHARTTLATLLWGDLADSNAKTNLRIELSNLNKVLGKHPALNITRNTVRFDHAWATVDVVDFRAAVTHFLALPIESQMVQLAQLTTALAGYQGEFLAGLHVDNALEFEEWQLLMREQLHEQAMQALTLLQQRHAEQGNWPALAAAARNIARNRHIPAVAAAHHHTLAADAFAALSVENKPVTVRSLRDRAGVSTAAATVITCSE